MISGSSSPRVLCATKDNEVFEYALSRALSPALIAEYRTRLPDKKLPQAKLHEFYALVQPLAETAEKSSGKSRRLVEASKGNRRK